MLSYRLREFVSMNSCIFKHYLCNGLHKFRGTFKTGFSMRQIATFSSSRAVKCSFAINYKVTFFEASKCVFVKIRPCTFRRLHSESSPYQINTNVAKDVILFKHENPKFFKILNSFAICQFIFWSYLSHFCFTQLRDAPVKQDKDEDHSWWRRVNLGENKYKNTLATVCFLIGYGILAASWMFTLRSVRFLILRKGGKEISFVTYAPFGTNRITTVGLENISAKESRKNARVQLPLKVKGHIMHYVLDMRGEFKNGQLFDSTAGLKRIFSS